MSHKILILDDDVDFNKLLTNIFLKAKDPYDIKSCEDPKKAVELINNGSFDLVVTDHRMPNITGFEFAQMVLKKNPDMPIIMVSAFLDSETIRQLINLGIGGIFLKPLNVFSLLERTKTILSNIAPSSDRGETSKWPPENHRNSKNNLLATFPCESMGSKNLSTSLEAQASKSGSVLFVGREGSPFESLIDDFKKLAANMEVRFVQLSWNDLSLEALKKKIPKEPSEKKPLFLIFPTIGLNTQPADIERITAILNQKKSWLNEEKWSLRSIYKLEETPDSLLDKNVLSDELYLLMGSNDIRIPALEELRDELPQLTRNLLNSIAEEEGKTPALIEAGAIDYLQSHAWQKDYKQLREVLNKAINIVGDGSITESMIKQICGSNADKNEKECFKSELENQCKDYAQFVYTLSDQDQDAATEQLGVNKGYLGRLTESVAL